MPVFLVAAGPLGPSMFGTVSCNIFPYLSKISLIKKKKKKDSLENGLVVSSLLSEKKKIDKAPLTRFMIMDTFLLYISNGRAVNLRN